MLQQYSAPDETDIMILSRHFVQSRENEGTLILSCMVQCNHIFIFFELKWKLHAQNQNDEKRSVLLAELVSVWFFLIFNEILLRTPSNGLKAMLFSILELFPFISIMQFEFLRAQCMALAFSRTIVHTYIHTYILYLFIHSKISS